MSRSAPEGKPMMVSAPVSVTTPRLFGLHA
jgi:hypothetical protein